LKNNILQNHAYIVPNKEIQYNEAKREFVEVAVQISHEMGGFARPAIDLITYQENVANSMKFVFGNFMIASSMEIATKIAYHPSNV
jgi:structural maintenance of chromosome 2